jgi:hypothetical protein
VEKRLRFADLRALGLVNNWVTLKNWIKKRGFPQGQLTGPNSRTWSEAEVKDWVAKRPTTAKPVPKSKGRPRKSVRAESQTLQP